MVEDTEMTKEVLKKLPAEWAEKSKLEYPLGWVNSEDVANACLFLLSDGSKKITGTNLVVDGGFSAQ
jgi:enoyl-[acyl-carrier-protein] reductase (NADH)